MSHDDVTRGRHWRAATWILFALHAATLVALCFTTKLTPDEAHYVLAGCILRQDLSFAAYNTVLHGPLALWPNQLGALLADPADFAAYAPWGRLGMLSFTLLAALAVVRMAQQAFGARFACLALLLWSTNPLVLAHGCLMTADMALTAGSAWTVYAFWRWLSAPSPLRLLAVGTLLGATLATKYLGVLLVVALGLALLVAVMSGFAPRLLWTRRSTTAPARLADGALASVLAGGAALAALHAAYLFREPGFRVNPPPEGVVVAPADPTFGPKSSTLRAVAATAAGRALLASLPEPWVRGADFQKAVSEGLPTFFGDEVAPGFWTYYLVAFAVKLPLVALALLALGLVVRSPPWPRSLGLVAGCAVAVPLVFLSGITRLQIGVRYALPVVPFLSLVAGRGLAWLTLGGTVARSLAAAAACALSAGVAFTWPRFLPAFNALAPRPYLWFRDSTLDWRAGAVAHDKDLAALRARHPDARVIDGALGPAFGRLLVHGSELGQRDPRDENRIYHWLRRFWPVDHTGAWFAFDVNEASFRAALADDASARGRGSVELAMALIGSAEPVSAGMEPVRALLATTDDQDRDRVLALLPELESGDTSRVAGAWLQLGRYDKILALGERAPREIRARALLLTGNPLAVTTLLDVPAAELTAPEVYLLATALDAVGRGPDAIDLLEHRRPSESAALQVHEQILQRLRQAVAAGLQTDPSRLKR
jgi:hypothetical protein